MPLRRVCLHLLAAVVRRRTKAFIGTGTRPCTCTKTLAQQRNGTSRTPCSSPLPAPQSAHSHLVSLMPCPPPSPLDLVVSSLLVSASPATSSSLPWPPGPNSTSMSQDLSLRPAFMRFSST